MKRTVVAMFPRYEDAERAVHQLLHQGVNRDDISIMALDGRRTDDSSATEDSKTAARAGTGAVVGGLAGAVLGITAVAIPGVGPLIAAGPITSLLSGIGGGLVAGGLLGAFIGLGLDHDAAKYYADGVQKGGAVVAVQSDEYQVEERLRALEASNVVAGQRSRSAELKGSDDRKGHEGQDGGTWDLPVKTDTGPEHWAPRNSAYSSSFDEFGGVLPRDESMLLAGRDPAFSGYKDAFSLGYRTGSSSDLANRSWPEVEADIRRQWDQQNPDTPWDRVAAYVHQGWETARGAG